MSLIGSCKTWFISFCTSFTFPVSPLVRREAVFTTTSVQSLSHVHSLRPHQPQHAKPPCPSATPRVHPNPCPLSRWCHSTVSSSVFPFSRSWAASQQAGLELRAPSIARCPASCPRSQLGVSWGWARETLKASRNSPCSGGPSSEPRQRGK